VKTTKFILAATIVAMTAASCGNKQEAPKTLVLYYSQTGNTRAVAEEFANRLGADIDEIVAVNPYDPDFQATIARCMQEREAGVTPEIQPLKVDVNSYDVIFLGYPVWFGTYAPPVITWLNGVDLSGKKIVPFCTFGSGGLESSVAELRKCQPNAQVLDGYGVRAARMDAMPKEVEQFLIANGFAEGEYTAPEPFGEQHEVDADEIDIFEAAVEGYPMLNAKAKSVAVRAIPDGTEYLFTAENLPKEGQPDMPIADIQVYVTVAGDAAPVFTKVVR
jgi:flavodoxin